MNYFYDLLINLNEKAYEFYEWEKDDEIIHLKRIPIFKISKEDLVKIMNNDIKLTEEFLNLIYRESECYDKKDNIDYITLFASNNGVIVLEFDNKGNSIYRSKLLLEEELEVLEYLYSIKLTNLDYQVISSINRENEIRQINKIKKIIETEINSLYQNNNIAKLRYLYTEVTNNNGDNIDVVKKELEEIIKSDFNNSHLKLYKLIKLSYKHLST